MKWKWCNLLLWNNVVLESFSNKPWGLLCDGFIKLVGSMANGKVLGAGDFANLSWAAWDLRPPESSGSWLCMLGGGGSRLPEATTCARLPYLSCDTLLCSSVCQMLPRCHHMPREQISHGTVSRSNVAGGEREEAYLPCRKMRVERR